MAESREELIKRAEAKWERDQLIARAEAKWERDNAPKSLAATPESVETGIRSALASGTLGISEPIISGLSALGGKVVEKLPVGPSAEDLGMIEGEAPSKSIGDLYSEDVARRARLKEESPISSAVGSIAGAVSPIGPAASLFKGAMSAGKAAGAFIPKVGESVGRVAGAALGAGGTVAAEEGVKAATGFKGDDVSALDAAKFGAGVDIGLQAIPKVGKAMSWGGKKLLSALGSVPMQSIEKYLADPGAINASKTTEEIKDMVDGVVNGLRDDVANKIVDVDTAKEVFKAFEQDLKEQLSGRKKEVTDLFRTAESNLKNAFNVEQRLLKEVGAPSYLVDDVVDSVNQLKRNLIEESGKASDILANSKENIAIAPIRKQLKKAIKAIKLEDVEFGPEDKKAIAALGGMLEDFNKLPDFMPLKKAKDLTKKIDRIVEYDLDIGSFDNPASIALKEIRSSLRKTLGELSPEYDKAMKEIVAPLGSLRERASKLFRTREQALSRMLHINTDANQITREVLSEIGEATGKDFIAPIQTFLSSKKTLASERALEQLYQGLPEYKEMAKAEELFKTFKDLAPAQEASKLALMSDQAMQLQKAEASLQAAKAELEPFKIFTEMNSQSRIQSVIRGSNAEVKKRMADLSKLSDQDFLKMIDDSAVKADFFKDATRGSKNTNLWAILGTGFGAGALSGDPITGILTGGAGAIFGQLVDRYGTQMAKYILDGVSKMNGIPTVQKIRKLSLPPAVVADLESSFIRTMTEMGQPMANAKLDPDTAEQVRMEIPRSTLTPTEKARTLTKLNSTGEVDNLGKIVLGGEIPKNNITRLEPASGKPSSQTPKGAVSDFISQKRKQAY
jgi:hypothetical protein